MSLELLSNFFIIPVTDSEAIYDEKMNDALVVDVSNTLKLRTNNFNFIIYNNKLNDKNTMRMIWNSYSNCNPIYVCYNKTTKKMLEYFLADFIKLYANGKQYKKELSSIIQTNLASL